MLSSFGRKCALSSLYSLLFFVLTWSVFAEPPALVGRLIHRQPRPLNIDEVVKARSALLIDANSRAVLFQRNTTMQHPPASTTKLMTALVAFETKGLDGSVRITGDDWAEPSSVPLIPGETVAVKDLFYSLMLGSDNDSARAVARHAGGSVEHFVEMMNAKATALGCHHTHFVNPNGLPHPGQYTCAEDLLKIFEAAIAIPELRRICSTEYYILRTQAKTQRLKNHNHLLGRYRGMGPAKTGWTQAARHTYAASAERDGIEIHLILLDSPNKWADAPPLLDYGFAQAKTLAENRARVSQSVAAAAVVSVPSPAATTAPAVPITSNSSGTTAGPTAVTSPTPSPIATPTTDEPSVPLKNTSYVIQSGDTLTSICQHFECSLTELRRLNHFSRHEVLHPGQTILVPGKS